MLMSTVQNYHERAARIAHRGKSNMDFIYLLEQMIAHSEVLGLARKESAHGLFVQRIAPEQYLPRSRDSVFELRLDGRPLDYDRDYLPDWRFVEGMVVRRECFTGMRGAGNGLPSYLKRPRPHLWPAAVDSRYFPEYPQVDISGNQITLRYSVGSTTPANRRERRKRN